MGVYTDALTARLPPWLRRTWGRLWAGSIGLFLDAVLTGSKEATKSHFILDCPEDAVPYHARDRHIIEIPGNTAEALRPRVAAAWTVWSQMGPSSGLRGYLAEVMNCNGLQVYDQAVDGWLSGFVSVSNLEDNNTDNASRIWVVMPKPHAWTVPTCGASLVCGPDMTCGITMTRAEVASLRKVARECRPAHIDPVEAYVLFDLTTAAAVLADHDASASYCRIPLYQTHVNYVHSATCGPSWICGETFD